MNSKAKASKGICRSNTSTTGTIPRQRWLNASVSCAATERLRVGETPQPDVSIVHGIPVVLQHQRTLRSSACEFCSGGGLSLKRHTILNEHAVMKNREEAPVHFAFGSRLRGSKYDVIGL